jgi:GNAT superfamily N-acetyltransferase
VTILSHELNVQIERVSLETANSAVFIQLVTDMINTVYEIAESGMWKAGTPRLLASETAELVLKGEIFIAQISDKIVGCVRIRRINENTYEFGLLVCKRELQGQGIGSALVKYAESYARANGGKFMQLELLFPKTWQHKSKEILKSWYERMGYRIIRNENFEIENGRHAGCLLEPCNFVVFQRQL